MEIPRAVSRSVCPSSTIRPRRTGTAPRIARSTVLLPEPFGPTSAVGPRANASCTSSVKPSRTRSNSSSSTDRLQLHVHPRPAPQEQEDRQRHYYQQDAERLGRTEIHL